MGPVNDSISGPKGKAISRSAAIVLAAVKSHFLLRMNTNWSDESKVLPFNRSIPESESPMADLCSISSTYPLNGQYFILFPWKRSTTVTCSYCHLVFLFLSISIRQRETPAAFNVMHLHQGGISWWIHSHTSINHSRTLTRGAQPPFNNNLNCSIA